MTDTTTEAVERLASDCGAACYGGTVKPWHTLKDAAATLRALAAERDAAKAEARITRTMIEARGTNRDYWEATAQAALAREARLREALQKVSERSRDAADPELTMETSWGNYDDVFFDGCRQSDYECAAIARAALAQEAPR